MGVFFRGREVRSSGWTAEPIVPPFPGVSLFGSSPADSPQQAMQTPAVWACVRLLADAVSMLPLHAYDVRGEARVQLPDPLLLTQPAGRTTITDWLYQVMVSLLLRGNAYGMIVSRDRYDYPTQIELLNPDAVAVREDPTTNAVAYYVNGRLVRTDDVWHLRAFSFPGLRVGLSPIAYAARTIGIDIGTANFAYGFFRDGAHPSAILTTEQPVSQEQAQTVKDRFLAAITGREPAVLGAGVQYKQIQVAPEESQFLATQKFNVSQIAKYFGVPPEMVGGESGGSMTYANVEQRNIEFLTYSVAPWLKRIEDAMFPLLPGAKYVRFNTGALLRTDLETRYKAHAIGIAAKFLHYDEARALEELPPLTQKQKDDLALVPLEVTPSGMPKAVPGATTVPEEPSEADPTAGETPK